MFKHPLSAFIYFTRNPSKVLPMGFVIVLAVFLIASVATIANSIDLTVRTIYRYTEFFTYVIPQKTTLRVPEDQIEVVNADPRIDQHFEGSIFFINIKTVIGRLPFVVLGVTEENRNHLMGRMGATLKEGRMPADGMPEVVLSEPIAENKHLKIGDVVAGPMDEGGISGAPQEVRLVGILKSDVWVAFTSKSYCDQTFLFTPKCYLYTAKDPKGLDVINADMMPPQDKLKGKLKPAKVQLLSKANLINEVRDSLSTMYLIMEVVTTTVIFVIALMSGMLANIYFTQRIAEFGVLHALGYSRGNLIRRIFSETLVMTLGGWILGGVLSIIVLTVLKDSVFRAKGLFINPTDIWAYQHTIPIPFCISAFAVMTIAIRLLRLDPVSVIEKR
jgi:ABC-type lipoprotein release transport system permease subunit